MPENVELLTPWSIPLTCHKNEGAVPPLLIDAVYVTWVPAQTGFAFVATEIAGITEGVTVTASVLGAEVLHTLDVVTETLPEVLPMVMVILSVPAPAVMVAPDGTVQL